MKSFFFFTFYSEMYLHNEKTELSTFYNIKCKIVYLDHLKIQNCGKIQKNNSPIKISFYFPVFPFFKSRYSPSNNEIRHLN